MEQVKKILDWLTAGDVEDREVRLATRRAKAASKRMVVQENRGASQAVVGTSKSYPYRPDRKGQVSVK